jgi:hypothetical protein
MLALQYAQKRQAASVRATVTASASLVLCLSAGHRHDSVGLRGDRN